MAPDLTKKKAVMTAALSEPMAILFSTRRLAENYRLECYGIKGRTRKKSRKSNPPSEPVYDTSPWDELRFEITQMEAKRFVLWIGVPTLESLGILGDDDD